MEHLKLNKLHSNVYHIINYWEKKRIFRFLKYVKLYLIILRCEDFFD
jgi:hypothetical protein